jgi:tetratricopeptide (TPR) repeat protein
MDVTMKYLIFAISVSILVTAGCGRDDGAADAPQTEVVWYASVEDARADAEAGSNLVLMSFEASWDPWSQLLHDSLFVDSTVVESLLAFRCTRVDVDVDTLARQEFGVNLYPTIVITDAYGSELGRVIGYQEPPVFLDALSPIKNRADRVTGMFAVEGMRRNDAEFLLTFGNLLFEMGVYDAALMRYEWAGEMDPDNASGIREESAFAMGECYMLSGRDKSAARTFRSFTSTYPESERAEEALLLAALCYERGGYKRAARDVLRSYRSLFEDGRFSAYVENKLEEGNR